MKLLLLLLLAFPVFAHDDNPQGHKTLLHQKELVAPFTVQQQPGFGADDGTVIDILVLFSTSGSGDIASQAAQAVAAVNTVWANSGITARLRLVATVQSSYVESGDVFNSALQYITADPTVANLRNQYAADLVTMLVADGTYCGLSYIGPSPNYATSVVNTNCALTNNSLAHELGHNFGARHDPFVDPATTPYAYGHGYLSPNGGVRDVMSYPNGCSFCARIPYYSNPATVINGWPLGDTTVSNVARVMNQNAFTVANFRTTVVSPPPPPPSPPPPCKQRGNSGKCR